MKHLLTILLTTLTITTAYTQNYQWAHGFGGPNYDAQGNSIATDAQGNVYVTGTFRDSIDFNPGIDTSYLVPSGGSNGPFTFIAKYDSSGSFIWAKCLNANPGQVEAEKLEVNSTGVYIAGHFFLNVDFDPSTSGTAILQSTGGWSGDEDIFLAKYDLNGNYVWAKSMGGINEDKALDLAIDNNGNSYITGYFRDTADFDPGVGVANLISEPFTDRFVSKYDINGNYLWAKDFSDNDSSGVVINKIAIDQTLNQIYIIGFFGNTIDFDRGGGVFFLSSSGAQDYDGFVCNYDSAFNFLWGGSISGNWFQNIAAIEIDKTGNGEITVAGGFTGVTDFDLGTGVLNLTASGSIYNGELFFAKYDGSGNNIWVKNIGNGTSIENIVSIKIDNNGDYLIAGSFSDTLDFDPSISIYDLISGAHLSPDIYFAKYDINFNFLWAKKIGDFNGEAPLQMSLDFQNNILLTGYYDGFFLADFDPGPSTVYLNSGTNNQSIFIAKYQNVITGIHDKDLKVNSNSRVFPNPTFNNLNIIVPEQIKSFTIYNSFGEIVFFNTLLTSNSPKSNIEINVSRLSSGSYYIKIDSNNNSIYYSRFTKL
ncbi:MAG TPA: T9SS type A sorting domain-containing protein [Bacteroidia bacterium]|nr:T9SS type A sorting domain-containing protein [Bacteroidia bacterium]HNU34395.1 T9SS type A sorting domain-containing protein [Bacteroidia bacterium]